MKTLLIKFLILSLSLSTVLVAAPTLSPTPAAIQPLPVGSVAPAPKLSDSEGHVVDLAELFSAKPTILVFYKAAWCGLGAKNLQQLRDGGPKLEKLGYQIIALSTDKPADLPPTRSKHGLSYVLLSDSELAASSAYGIAYRASPEQISTYAAKGITLAPIPGDPEGGRWLLVPAVFIIGRDRRIQWAYTSLNKNPTLEALLSEAALLIK